MVGQDNSQVDWLSEKTLDQSEWLLKPFQMHFARYVSGSAWWRWTFMQMISTVTPSSPVKLHYLEAEHKQLLEMDYAEGASSRQSV